MTNTKKQPCRRASYKPPQINYNLPCPQPTLEEVKQRWKKHLEDTRLSNIAFRPGLEANKR